MTETKKTIVIIVISMIVGFLFMRSAYIKANSMMSGELKAWEIKCTDEMLKISE